MISCHFYKLCILDYKRDNSELYIHLLPLAFILQFFIISLLTILKMLVGIYKFKFPSYDILHILQHHLSAI